MNQAQSKLVADVRDYGWHVLNVFSPEGRRPNFSYSVGIYESFGHPELIVFGLSLETGHKLINVVGDAIKAGREFQHGTSSADLIEGYDCVFRAVPRHLYPEYFGLGIWFHGDEEFPVLQLVYPDRYGRWPWDEGVDAGFRASQPILMDVPE
jgi:hypothetical protein